MEERSAFGAVCAGRHEVRRDSVIQVVEAPKTLRRARLGR